MAVGTEAFRGEADDQAAALGMPDYRMLEMLHPIPLEDLLGFAEVVVEEVAALPTDGDR